MRALLFAFALTALAGCRIDPPGHGDVFAASQLLFEDHTGRWKSTELSADSLDRALELLDRATAAGHPFASSTKAFAVLIHDSQLAAEPHFRSVIEDKHTSQQHRDQAYSMLASIAHMRPMLAADLKWKDIPPDQHLAWADVLGEVSVLREARAAGSQRADSLLQQRIDILYDQRDAGNTDADSLLALVELG